MLLRRLSLAGVALLALTAVAVADEQQPVTDRDVFEDLVANKELTSLGVTLIVTPDGGITGRAFGKDVSGEWDWREGYFCRDLMFGDTPLEPNCQQVTHAGDRITFTSDFGTGQSAKLRIR